MDSAEYVELLAKEVRLQEELNTVSNRLYELQQEMLKHFGNNAGSIVAEALVP
tara:strand:- start:905 stop:1063 length:159 start_codon:yes stop_codon:yes gene_type:complete